MKSYLFDLNTFVVSVVVRKLTAKQHHVSIIPKNLPIPAKMFQPSSCIPI
jgi:hypothetical protein